MAQLIINGTDYQIQDIIRGLSMRNSSIKQINWNIADDSYTLDLPSHDEHDVPVATSKRNPPKPQTPPQEKPIKQSHQHKTKVCAGCGKDFIPNGGRQIYCIDCKGERRHISPKPVSSGEEEPR